MKDRLFLIIFSAYIVFFVNKEAKGRVKSLILPIYAVPVWCRLALRKDKDKDRIVKLFRFSAQIIHPDCNYLKLTVDVFAKEEFIRMTTKINGDYNQVLQKLFQKAQCEITEKFIKCIHFTEVRDNFTQELFLLQSSPLQSI